MDSKKMGEFILALRKEKGMTQEDLSAKLNIGHKSISKWECGVSAPSMANLSALSKIFGVTISELILGERTKKDVSIEERAAMAVDNYVISYKRKWLIIASGVVGFFVLVIISLLATFTYNNYNKNQVYDVISLNENYSISGYAVLTSTMNLIIIDGLSIKGTLIGTSLEPMVSNITYSLVIDESVVFLKSGDKLLESATPISEVLENVSFNFIEDKTSNTNILTYDNIQSRIKLCLNILDENNNSNEIDIPLKMDSLYTNDKLVY